ncbi:hypothetical protein BDN72DRAFT_739900, partial [Pluteus cervinus]
TKPEVVTDVSTKPQDSSAKPQLHPGHASRHLQMRCPACFGLEKWGRSLIESGGDVHVALDGNFHHRHLARAGDGPRAGIPEWIIPKSDVDEAGERITKARKSKPKSYTPLVPHEAVDLCKESYDAANESKQKANAERYDDTGLMCLVCRHDIPIFLANIDTPGE